MFVLTLFFNYLTLLWELTQLKENIMEDRYYVMCDSSNSCPYKDPRDIDIAGDNIPGANLTGVGNIFLYINLILFSL